MAAFPDIPQLATSEHHPIKGEKKDYTANGNPNFRSFFTDKFRRVPKFYIDEVDWVALENHFKGDSANAFLFTDQRDGTVITVRYDVGGNPRRGRGDDVPVGKFLASVRLIDA